MDLFAKLGSGKSSEKCAVSPVGQLIDVATDGDSNMTENWTMFMEICDLINVTEDGYDKLRVCGAVYPKEAVKRMRKKFATRDANTIDYTLVLLKSCVKNCGKRFHVQIATKDFLNDLLRIISPKNHQPVQTQLMVLGLIQTWAYAFNQHPELKEVGRIYNELKEKDVEFPPLERLQFPPTIVPTNPTSRKTKPDRHHSSSSRTRPFKPIVSSSSMSSASYSQRPSHPSSHGVKSTGVSSSSSSSSQSRHHSTVVIPAASSMKLKSEIDVVQQNCRVFSEVLTEMNPSQENQSDVEFLEVSQQFQNEVDIYSILLKWLQYGRRSSDGNRANIRATMEQSTKQSRAARIIAYFHLMNDGLYQRIKVVDNFAEFLYLFVPIDVQDLNKTCQQMHQRIKELIPRIDNEQITVELHSELWSASDALNNVFLRYERYKRLRAAAKQNPASQQPSLRSVSSDQISTRPPPFFTSSPRMPAKNAVTADMPPKNPSNLIGPAALFAPPTVPLQCSEQINQPKIAVNNNYTSLEYRATKPTSNPVHHIKDPPIASLIDFDDHDSSASACLKSHDYSSSAARGTEVANDDADIYSEIHLASEMEDLAVTRNQPPSISVEFNESSVGTAVTSSVDSLADLEFVRFLTDHQGIETRPRLDTPPRTSRTLGQGRRTIAEPNEPLFSL